MVSKRLTFLTFGNRPEKRKKILGENESRVYIIYLGGGGVSRDAAVPDKEGREDALKDARL